MAFWRKDHAVKWRGVGSAHLLAATLGTGYDLMEALLKSYEDIFQEPSGVPPTRRHDHRIHLLPGTAPVAVQPYRYP
uniref:Uncharacterized protein n=1 Tax=Arundo donax TaxID=35708 RepID=A0A0A9G8Q5_ARUDO